MPAHLDEEEQHHKRRKYLKGGGTQAHIDGNCGAVWLAKDGDNQHDVDKQLYLHAELREMVTVAEQNHLVSVWREEKEWRQAHGIQTADQEEVDMISAFNAHMDKMDEQDMNYDPFNNDTDQGLQQEQPQETKTPAAVGEPVEAAPAGNVESQNGIPDAKASNPDIDAYLNQAYPGWMDG